MKQKLYIIIICIAILSINIFSASTNEKLRIAVVDFTGKGVSAMDAAAVADFFRNDLVNTNKFTLVDRSNMETILTEQQFQASGCTSNECAVKMGKLLNVQNIIVGTLTKFGGTFYISIRMLNVQTSEILLSKEVSANTIGDIRAATKKLALSLAGVEQEKPEKKKVTKEELKVPEPKKEVKTEKKPIELPPAEPEQEEEKSTFLSNTLGTVFTLAGTVFLVKGFLKNSSANENYDNYYNSTNQDEMDYYYNKSDDLSRRAKLNFIIGGGCVGVGTTFFILEF